MKTLVPALFILTILSGCTGMPVVHYVVPPTYSPYYIPAPPPTPPAPVPPGGIAQPVPLAPVQAAVVCAPPAQLVWNGGQAVCVAPQPSSSLTIIHTVPVFNPYPYYGSQSLYLCIKCRR
jgi:hypothetical protein